MTGPRLAAVATPCGPLLVMAVEDIVIASGWTRDETALVASISPADRPDGWAFVRDLGPITEAVAAYLDGDLEAVRAVAVGQRSGPFVERAWETLRAVPPGTTVTYRTLAARCGRPAAARAAGMACGRNAAALFVPCHRAVPGDGGGGGFRWGLAVKRWLLDHEATRSSGAKRYGTGSDWQLPGHGVVGVEAAIDDVLHRQHPRRGQQGDEGL